MTGGANADKLRALIQAHKLTRAEVAEILSEASGERVSIDTVHAWLRPAHNKSARNMPGAKLKLLELALATRSGSTPAGLRPSSGARSWRRSHD